MFDEKNMEEFNGKYINQTIYILGSGPSITHQNISLLHDKITIAVNSGYLALPNATFFISDDWSVANWSYFFNELKNSKTTNVLLYEEKLKNSAQLFGKRSFLFRHKSGINIPDKYMHNNPEFHLGETRTSFGSAIMTARILGANKIVCLGLDCCRLDGYRYFWQMPEFKGNKPFRNDKIKIDHYQKCKINNQITDTDLTEIHHSWNKLGQKLNQKCTIYNVSSISKLDIFPKEKLENLV